MDHVGYREVVEVLGPESVDAKHGPIALIHFDAHLDTWDTYFNSPITHGTVFRRAFEEGLLAKGKSIHLGIRGPI